MAETIKSLLSRARRSYAAAEKAGDYDVICRHGYAAALAAVRAIGLRNGDVMDRSSLGEQLGTMGLDSLVPAGYALDACFLGWSDSHAAHGSLIWSEEGPTATMRFGAFSREHGEIVLPCAKQILAVVEGACG